MALSIRGLNLEEHAPGIWRIARFGKMRADVHLVGTASIFNKLKDDRSLEQALAVAHLPGILNPVLTMPDIHQGYGFPIGGVAAFHAKTGVVSPGGVGYDINCGVRFLTSELTKDAMEKDRLRELVADLFRAIPAGVGSQRKDVSFAASQLEEILEEGAGWAIRNGFGFEADRECLEERGQIRGANPDKVSERAKERGQGQLGTLGSGNHFVEVQFVDDIFDKQAAEAFGLFKNQIVFTIHTGSRGLGYQVCSDYLESSFKAAKKNDLELPSRELAAAPLDSIEGKSYLAAMAAAANFAFTNRQLITHWLRDTVDKHFPKQRIKVVYDICHNIAKMEEMPTERGSQPVCVHRKGATRAYPPKHPSLPKPYQDVGQPVLVPGDMGRYSFVLAGNAGSLEKSWGSACHGAGRELSRSQAKKHGKGRAIIRELEDQGIIVKAAGRETVVEEMPEAYKDVTEVVGSVATAGIARIVARLKPLGVVKG